MEFMQRSTQLCVQNETSTSGGESIHSPNKYKGVQGQTCEQNESLLQPLTGAFKELHNKYYHDSFFSIMVKLREGGLLVDWSVQVGGTLYDIHCFVLAAVSLFFFSLLEERNTPRTVDLEGKVTVKGWEAILHFAYQGTLHLQKETAEEIQLAAEALQVPRVAAACKRYYKSLAAVAASDEKCETLRSIQKLYRRGFGCDVHLQASNTSFFAHRAALAAGSDFFHGMFTSGMREARQETIVLKTLSVSNLCLFIDFVYSGALKISWDNAFEKTEAALQYQLEGMIPLCFQFMREEMTTESSLDVISFANAYGLHDLKIFTEKFVLRNFKQVVALQKYLDLTAEEIVAFLSQDALYTTTELEVFHSVLRWINTDRKSRLCQAVKLMQCVRFPLITNREMRQILAVDLMAPSGKCYKVLEASLLSVPRGPSVISQLPCRMRLPDKVLVIIGGDSLNEDFSNRAPSKKMQFAHKFITGIGLVKYIEWRHLTCLPDVPRFRHGVVALNDTIYVFGGNYYYGKQDVLKTAVRYSPLEDKWDHLTDMKECHSYFPIVCLDGQIYILGGNTDTTNTQCLDSVECYNPANNTWTYAHALPQPLCGHAAAVCNERIYVSGGCDNTNQCLALMYLYDPTNGATYLSSMSAVRAGHVMETIRGKLYVAGGLGQGINGYEDQYMCEVYCPISDSWTQVASLTQAHVVAASAILQDELYILGGYSYETYRDSHMVHCYDPKTDRWVSLGTMPNAFADMKACVLSVPTHQRQPAIAGQQTST
ncbi:kelch-like protein 33 [Ambystoma mexicanum]|uniref:kelch-like protein 33 n=1 Tax=Ambystoma mexicanum TaxID=8296 RepID=UPI0037E727BD